MSETVVININGRRKTVSKFEAACMQQANKAAAGDPKAMKLMMDVMAGAQMRDEARDVGVEVSPEARRAADAKLLSHLAGPNSEFEQMPFDLDPRFDAELRDAVIRNDFAAFAQIMFPEVMPGIDLVWASYLTFVCAMLEDVAHGRRRKLIITIPPRHLKSFLVSVALPAYLLGHYPGFEVMCVSYGYELAKGFAEQCQTIMRSETFVRLFGRVLPQRRQPIHTLRTLKGGMRRATSLDGVATGVGGQLLIFDDPQKPGEALSDAIRRSTNELYQNTFHSRSNDPANQRTIIVMQRLHEEDFVAFVSGLNPSSRSSICRPSPSRMRHSPIRRSWVSMFFAGARAKP